MGNHGQIQELFLICVKRGETPCAYIINTILVSVGFLNLMSVFYSAYFLEYSLEQSNKKIKK